MRHRIWSHVVFAAALATLLVLGSWWTIFHNRALETEREAKLLVLQRDALVAQCEGAGITPAPAPPKAALVAIEEKAHRRHIMVTGEATLLFTLIGVCVFMLYRLVSQEREYRGRVEEFVESVTHEMKTPLAGIKSLLQTLAAGRVPDAQQRELSVLGLKEAERLEHTVENCLMAGRIRLGEDHVAMENVKLRELLDRFTEHRRGYLFDDPSAIDLSWEMEAAEATVSADPRAVVAILENLTDNAFKYGGDKPRVTVRAKDEGGRVAISVEDQGVGFPPEQAALLFEPFHRALGKGSVAVHGSGLGLSIAKALALRMGAQLSAASDGPGKGSRFTLTLRTKGAS
ncbi:MAG: HAMP domain-containing sensor histidine kinase [Deltaproteobacteria bacterium]|nr:HAMP domain-containing sensor histidine kinase [Deltaproteobacteria bacterium]